MVGHDGRGLPQAVEQHLEDFKAFAEQDQDVRNAKD
jgi:hypothetical protein